MFCETKRCAAWAAMGLRTRPWAASTACSCGFAEFHHGLRQASLLVQSLLTGVNRNS